jgi:hypothetical protein
LPVSIIISIFLSVFENSAPFLNIKTLIMNKLYLLFVLFTALNSQSQAQTTYKDVANIFYTRCTSCHHENQHAPSMMNYTETYANTASMKSDLLSGKMPPWPPDTTYHRYLQERLISSSEKTAILNWISGGALKGDTTQAPPAPLYSSQAKLVGNPDLILKIPTFASNATSTSDVYNCFAIPTGLTQDRIIRAYEIIPGNVPIVHHVIANVDTTGSVNSDLSGACFTEPGQFSIGGYVPGCSPTIFPSRAPLKAGIRLKAGSKIILQIHYPIGTGGQKDSTQIRIFFYPLGTTGVRPIYVTTPLQNWNLVLPANMVTPFTAKYPSSGGLTTNLSVLAVSPHSHKVCTSMIVNAYGPANDTIPLCRINKWNFDWQGYYTFPKMVKIPTGYTLYSKHIYDNTTNNVNNPNSPPKMVVAGTSTTNEMLFDSFQFLLYQAGDDTIDIGHIINTDPLVTSVPEKGQASQQIRSFVYPNPFSDNATVVLNSELPIYNAEFRMFDMMGKEVFSQMLHNPSAEGFIIHRGNLPAGIYFYVIKAGSASGNGKMVLMSK